MARQLNDAETRAALTLAFSATQFGRRTIASWICRKRKPTQDEMFEICAWLQNAESLIEQLVHGPPTDGHTLDGDIFALNDYMRERLGELN